jgi:hypothetical protein
MFDIYWYDYDTIDFLSVIESAKKSSKTEYVWVLHRGVDYTNFNLRWMPNRHQLQMLHAWASHNNPSCFTTWLIPVNSDWDKSEKVFHDSILPKNNKPYYEICCINTGMDEQHTCNFSIRLITTMVETVKNAVRKSNATWLWIVADCCDYTNFDFNWLPNTFEQNHVHCWPSGMCEKGDTFLIHVPSFSENIIWNFNHLSVPRKPWPVIQYSEDNLADALKYKSNAIYTLLQKGNIGTIPDVCLWENRPVVSLNNSNSSCLVPRDCIVKHEIYEYPHLLKNAEDIKTQYDIVFISYDETQADKNYTKLLEKYPYAKRVHGIEGMENALAAAAKCSDTDYFYAVFAKTKLYENWDFTSEPDYWRDPRNYIFYAINTSNDLVYGEMGIILYNKNFLLTAPSYDELGIDFTMSFPVQVIPQISAYGEFATDSYRAWRTAFRETCKLAYFNSQSPCIETQYRIHRWKTYAHGDYASDVLRGANDGYQYFINNSNDIAALKKTFRWDWLKNFYNSKYN